MLHLMHGDKTVGLENLTGQLDHWELPPRIVLYLTSSKPGERMWTPEAGQSGADQHGFFLY